MLKLNHVIIGVLASAAIYFFIASAHGIRLPMFSDFPVENVFSGEHVKPNVEEAPARTFRTRLRYAAEQEVNFAGEYVFTTWGCGTSCAMAALVNVRTGDSIVIDDTFCCWYGEEDWFDYRPDSRLLIIRGRLGEFSEEHGIHYFVLEEGALHRIHFAPLREFDD
ncbi:hypothetical protein FM042_11635 [Aliidiomarina halalkaliphila]|uniref:Uncharacterized protein n=1 Tax=Aliidiomarina halalkaliphila TaxID=2593535 RepID=A0A552WZ70_9GAMM|nr:hypothetical protein [Aliidiomarina halalkaliphila]TRW47976.1 hypothetical protein FM042_11635 [Aliidiomarina halalkaliphila]